MSQNNQSIYKDLDPTEFSLQTEELRSSIVNMYLIGSLTPDVEKFLNTIPIEDRKELFPMYNHQLLQEINVSFIDYLNMNYHNGFIVKVMVPLTKKHRFQEEVPENYEGPVYDGKFLTGWESKNSKRARYAYADSLRLLIEEIKMTEDISLLLDITDSKSKN